jgi:hypothetical protein
MTMDLTQIGLTVVVMGVAVAIIVWHLSNVAAASAASARRMMGMMKHFGMDPRAVMNGDRQAKAIGNDLKRLCSRCRRRGLCDMWLAGEVKGSSTFCPNAEAFRILAWSGAARLL